MKPDSETVLGKFVIWNAKHFAECLFKMNDSKYFAGCRYEEDFDEVFDKLSFKIKLKLCWYLLLSLPFCVAIVMVCLFKRNLWNLV